MGIFLGIPYAAPPVGNLRWRPPQAVEHWHAPRDATQFGSSCPQVTELGAFAGPGSINEDCLYLNVFTSNFGHNGSRNPVLVWIHGGGNVDGESSDYDGSKLATGGPIGRPTVVVTMNYRMGLFGFLAHPALDNEGHPFGNYGILDQQAVLRWVQRNIEAFGGDPGRVTLGGQSAGAIDTGASMLSPMATGLFQRAIFQSAPVTNSFYVTLSDALSKGTAFATAAGGEQAHPELVAVPLERRELCTRKRILDRAVGGRHRVGGGARAQRAVEAVLELAVKVQRKQFQEMKLSHAPGC